MKSLTFLISIVLVHLPVYGQGAYGELSDGAIEASLHYLIANPGEMTGALVETYGVVNLNFEEISLFTDEGSFNHFIPQNRLVLDIDFQELGLDRNARDAFYGKWVRIQGEFHGYAHTKRGCSTEDKPMCIRIGASSAGILTNVSFIGEEIDFSKER